MTVYAIAMINMRNREWLPNYSDKADVLIAKYGGRYVVRGVQPEQIEGKNILPDIIVILEFPSLETAKAWHSDPDYQDLIEVRNKGSDTDFLLVQGV